MTRPARSSPLPSASQLAWLALALLAPLHAKEEAAKPGASHAPAEAAHPAAAEPHPTEAAEPETTGPEAAKSEHASSKAKGAKTEPHKSEPTKSGPAKGRGQKAKAPAPAPAESAAHAKASDHPVTERGADGKLTPAEIEGLLKLGVSLGDRGDYESSEIAFRQVLDSPTTPEHELKTALLGLAHMFRQQGSLTKASAIFERFLKDYPGDDRTPDALLELGRTLRSLGVHKMAVARFYSVINSTLKLPGEGFDRYQLLAKTAQFEIAETFFQAGEFAEANKYYNRLRLLDLAPADRARAHFKAGYSLRLQGDLENAVASLRSYIAQWPDDENIPEARYLLAVSLRELKRPQEAFAATLELLRTEKSRIATDPKRWAYWQRRTGNQLANDFFETGDTLNARAVYAGLLELSPEPAWKMPITYQVGLCDERLGIYDRARAAYKSIVDLAGEKPAPDFQELVTMAKWRIDHLEWRERAGQQIVSMFDSTPAQQPTTGQPSAAAAVATPPSTPPAPAPAAAGTTPSPTSATP